MTVQHISDMKTPIGEVLHAAGTGGALLEPAGQTKYAVIPLDDDLLDYLIERDPRFIEACQQARTAMRAGKFRSHQEVKAL